MSEIRTITIDSIFDGHQPSEYFGGQGQFLSSIGIDPDMPKDDSSKKPSGLIRPTAMEEFSGAILNDAPMWILTNPKDNKVYTYLKNGRIVSYSSALGSETNVATPTSGAGNGAAYYDNYLYFATPTNISRYGRLDGTPSLTNSYWTSTLSMTALENTTYPSIRGIAIPNHPMHRHTDDKLYFADVGTDNKGYIHYIKTRKGTNEGDTDDTSVEKALDFDYGLYPTCIATFGTDLVIGLIEGTDTTTKQKPAKISFWDTTSSSFSKITDVELPDPLITALINVNGILYAFTGNASGGVRLIRFIGGYSFEEVFYWEEGVPPFQGAVDHILNRIVWGGYTTDPEASASVLAINSKKNALPMGIHNILNSTSTGTNQIVTALKYVMHADNAIRAPIVGWTDDSADGLDKISTTYGVSVFRSGVKRIGRSFKIKQINIPFVQAVSANMIITPKMFIDGASSSKTLKVINNTNFPNSERRAELNPDGVKGETDFFLELRMTGTALLTVGLPITIDVEIYG